MWHKIQKKLTCRPSQMSHFDPQNITWLYFNILKIRVTADVVDLVRWFPFGVLWSEPHAEPAKAARLRHNDRLHAARLPVQNIPKPLRHRDGKSTRSTRSTFAMFTAESKAKIRNEAWKLRTPIPCLSPTSGKRKKIWVRIFQASFRIFALLSGVNMANVDLGLGPQIQMRSSGCLKVDTYYSMTICELTGDLHSLVVQIRGEMTE